jgi:ubiquinone/menaquinone biosynthesis C-methylase UbiE
MSNRRNFKGSFAFGVEPGLPPYRLRQARYQALAEDVSKLAMDHFWQNRRPLDLLDVGVGDGVSMRYLEVHSGAQHIRYHGVDMFPKGRQRVYKSDQWQLEHANLEEGMPHIPSDNYDLVICEQVLEHLTQCRRGLDELVRVLRPGGTLVLGVPIFVHGLHTVRNELLSRQLIKPRGHVQSFSKRSFVQMLEDTGQLDVQQVRGFRIVSGGVLRPLEFCRWWWKLNRWIGAVVPSLCIEIQVCARKKAAAAITEVAQRRAA